MKKVIRSLIGMDKYRVYFNHEFDKLKVLSAQTINKQVISNAGKLENIQEAEFSVFAQWGDDGIIQYLIHTLGIENKIFIEFGVENYQEANTRYLLINNNWKGLVLDGSEENINYIKNDEISWRYNITAVCQFLTVENLNETIKNAGFEGDIGILHIDVDGNDYWLWECLNIVNPEIVIMEYNSMFGNKAAFTVPYKNNFYVTNEHYSNLYFGASLKAMEHLAIKKGYTLVGCNSNGNNAYFVRNDKLKNMLPTTADKSYVKAMSRQNRDEQGKLTFIDDFEAIKKCADLPVIDIITNQTLNLKQLI